MAKVFLGVGHGGNDPGAVKYVVEKDVNLVMALACKDYLEANGVQVKMSRTKDENDSLTEEIRECNAYNPDLAVDIHNNAGGGDGFEVYHSINGGKGKTLAQNIEKEIKAIGQNSRGLKTKREGNSDYYGFIRLTKCPAIIVEGFFVDNANDVKIADTNAEQKAFGVAYAKGILKTLGINSSVNSGVNSGVNNATTQAKKTVEQLAKEVMAGDWDNGATRKKLLTEAGYDYYAVQAKVNEIMLGKTTTPKKKSNEEIAKEVMQGKWDNGATRKKLLTEAGYDYYAIQKIVNSKYY